MIRVWLRRQLRREALGCKLSTRSATTISSASNDVIRTCISLQDTGKRDKHQMFLVEGMRNISTLVAASLMPNVILVRDGNEVPKSWPFSRVSFVTEKVSCAVSSVTTPSGYTACFPTPPSIDIRKRLFEAGLVLWHVMDPGNIGTLLRCAAAFRFRNVLLVNCADCYSPKVVQAAAGALAQLNIARVKEDFDLQQLTPKVDLCGLVAHDGRKLQQIDWTQKRPRWLVIGNEAHGLSADVLSRCKERVTIDMAPGVESLNAAVAGAIVMHHQFMNR
eukprot:TRINITY_DN14269_c0_g1_i1.p1 TRINITY_DN14269_c0_g1~~TRINITY_DN14269_c0_g1_i1.p1  ORF type:complete len:276 (+),score=45.10 TRINITY_DN14269_c0_g1_i1:29-856(+)